MRIVFSYPSKNIGGAQLLFARICKHISEKKLNVAVISDGQCFLSKYLIKHKIKHEIIEASLSNHLNKNDVLVLSLAQIYMYENIIKLAPDSRVVFWDLYPFNLLQWMYFFQIYKYDTQSVIAKFFKLLENKRKNKMAYFCNIAHSNNALFFMCKKNFKINADFFDLSFEPKYIPIPIVDNCQYSQSSNIKQQKVNLKEINIGWISRLAKDKVKVLLALIEDLELYAKNRNDLCIKLHVIGDGSASVHILESKYIQVLCKGRLENLELDEYLDNNIDIGFSMGTAAIEFAIRGVPSVLVPNSASNSKSLKRQRKYIWLFNAEGFDVAAESYYEDALSIESILEEYNLSSNALAKRSFFHAKIHHSLNNVSELLLNSIYCSSLTGSDMEKLKLSENSVFERSLLYLKKTIKSFLSRRVHPH